MLHASRMSACIATTDIARAKEFYGAKLGLKIANEMGPAVFFATPSGELFVYQREKPPTPDATVATWWVDDVRAVVKGLKAKGVKFEIYEGFGQDADGISALGPQGPWAAWFKDPDGNVLGVTQLPRG